MRKGWVSCKKAWEFLEQNKMTISTEINAKKQTIKAAEAQELLTSAAEIIVASGKKILTYTPGADDEMLKKVTGRTGNLRAPSLLIKNKYYIGFNQDLYQQISQLG